MSEHTLRDTFAAAALTGMLRKRLPGSVFDLTITARQAFEIADAMLGGRARNGAPDARETVTDHDAAPAARAVADRERPDNPPARPGDGTGDTPTLTDAEREAIQTAIDILTDPVCRTENKQTETLHALLARLGGAE